MRSRRPPEAGSFRQPGEKGLHFLDNAGLLRIADEILHLVRVAAAVEKHGASVVPLGVTPLFRPKDESSRILPEEFGKGNIPQR